MWKLSEISEGTWLSADNDGLWIKCNNTDLGSRSAIPKNRLGRLLPALIPQLQDLGFARQVGNDVLIHFEDLVEFEDSDIDAFQNIVPWSPFAVELETASSILQQDFRYNVRFYWGRQQVYIERLGCFIKRNRIIYRLEKQTFRLLEAIDSFNSLPREEKEDRHAFNIFSNIKGIAEEVGAEIDKYISSERVIIPTKINLDIIEEQDGRISFVPKIDQVPTDGLFRAYLVNDNIEDVYSVIDEAGGRVRVILDEDQKEVLRRMQKVRHLGGVEKANVLRNPYEVFDGVVNSIEIDLTQFGPRVKGIGDFPFVSQPFVKYSETGIFEDIPEEIGSVPKRLDAGIDCEYLDGTVDKMYFDNKPHLLDVYHKTKVAWETGERTIDLNGRTIIVNKGFVEGLKSIVDLVTKPKKDRERKVEQQAYLLIYTNEDKLEYREEDEINQIPKESLSLPDALDKETALKSYQMEGIRWLQINYFLNEKCGRRGCLLADEMGLGKTLQILTFLAWAIENGAVAATSYQNGENKYNPILVVTPVMLLENENWQKDMKRFFRYDGDIFQPYLILHGKSLRSMKKPGTSGRETVIRESVLDLDQLRHFRIVFTSYETIVNYQYSFAMMKDCWSMVITDEAQEYKTANTKISHALKSLSPRIRIGCTGTPVETKLMDIWNIFDFLQPGLLGSAAEFAKQYERPLFEDPDRRTEILNIIKDKLHFGKAYAYVLRRDKHKTLDGLPCKHEHKVYCNLSPAQRERHIDFVNQVHSQEDGGHPLAILQQLMKLYQHPDLLPTYQGLAEGEAERAIERSPKLQAVFDILNQIREKREKVLIFTRSLHMQQMLSALITSRFGTIVDIINGMVPRAGSTKSGKSTRTESIRRFCESDGFNVLVVSPDVAGVGLTIVEANHVIHYGRWWNPAKEMQATDRVYRIGQERDVHVYYPIAQDPQGIIKTFDERLDSLIDKRRELAKEFLAPMPGDRENGGELMDELLGQYSNAKDETRINALSEQELASLPWDRFEALVALLEKRAGRHVILTPKSGDFGVDILSIKDKVVHLVQCKHTIWNSNCDTDTVAEVINAFDNYRLHWLRGFQNVLLKPSLVTNGKLTRSVLSLANEREVETVDSKKLVNLLNKYPCTLAEIEMMENSRCTGMKEVEDKARLLLC